jgi:cyclophilin family peptidyl-prolyl cis-trans isomerase
MENTLFFGKVVEGQDVVDAIAQDDVIETLGH